MKLGVRSGYEKRRERERGWERRARRGWEGNEGYENARDGKMEGDRVRGWVEGMERERRREQKGGRGQGGTGEGKEGGGEEWEGREGGEGK